jgi:hypothetical protein
MILKYNLNIYKMYKYLFNPYLGVFCSGYTFQKLNCFLHKTKTKDINKVRGYIAWKTVSAGLIGSCIPLTTLYIILNSKDRFFV